MSKPSEMEYRIAREQWHIEMAKSAESFEAAASHMELARRYGNYDFPLPKEVPIDRQ